MKKIITLIAVIALSCTTVNAEAGHTRKSTALGAVTGAAIGQAIGHNTEATLIGIAVGGVTGYIVGNEMDKNGHVRPIRVVREEPLHKVHKHVTVIVEPSRRTHQPHKKWYKKHHKNNKYHGKRCRSHSHRARNNHPGYSFDRGFQQHRVVW